MDFANPLFLFALPLALAPLILHLFYHRKRAVVRFSTLHFFLKKEKFFAYRRRLLEILLMCFRILVLLFVILALSRPFFKKLSFIAGAGTEAVIVLDDSMSMERSAPGGRTSFEIAVRQAETLMNSLNKDDSAGLIFLSGRDGVMPTREKQKVVTALRGAKPTGTAGNPAIAIRRAVELLKKSQGINREIYWITDLQKTMLPQRKIQLSDLGNGRLFLIPVSGSPENCSISGGVVDPALKTPGTSVFIPFTIRNSGSRDRILKAELNITGNIVQAKNITVKAGASVNDHFVYQPVRAGRVDGVISIDDDNVPLDNRLPFSFTVSDVLKVLLLSEQSPEEPDPFYYLKMAIAPRPLAHGIEVKEAPFRTMGELNLKEYPLIFVAPGSSFHPDVVGKLLEHIRNGGSVAGLPEREGSQRFYTALAERSENRLPVPFTGPQTNGGRGIIFTQWLSPLNDLLQLNLIQWKRLAGLKAGKERVLARTGFLPAIAEFPYGSGRLIIFAFDLRRRSSNWPELKSFPIAMNTFVNYAAGTRDPSVHITCGEEICPGGKAVSFTDSHGNSGKLTSPVFKKTRLPGIVLFSGGRIESAVITPAERESLLETVPKNSVSRLFDSPVSILSPEEDPVFQIGRLRRGTDLSGLLFLTALLLAAAEFALGSDLSKFRIRKEAGK